MIFLKRQKGFTLVEMILYVSLSSILLLSLSGLMSSLLESRVKSQAISEVNQQGFQVMSNIIQTIRNGRSIESPSIGVSSSTLSLTTSNGILNPTQFFLSSTTLMVREGAKQPIELTNSRVVVSSLLFQNISSNLSTEKVIKISFTITYVNKNSKGEYQFTKTFNGSAIMH